MIAIVAALSIGIGANIIAFSWIHSIFIDPLPGVRAGAALRVVFPRTPDQIAMNDTIRYYKPSYPEYLEITRRVRAEADVLASRLLPLTLSEGGSEPARLFTEATSDNFFAVLGVKPALGRFYDSRDDSPPDAPGVVVISHSFWRKHFSDDPGAIGKTIRINNHDFTIVGVTPEAFQGTTVGIAMDVWIPIKSLPKVYPGNKDLTTRTARVVTAYTRLKPGAAVAKVSADIEACYGQWRQKNPGVYTDPVKVSLLPFWRNPQGAQLMMLPALGTMEALAILVLLLTCSTTVILLLARATARQKELSIRLAVGASTGQIVSLLLTESLTLALTGSAGALLFANWGLQALINAMPLPTAFPVKLALTIRPAEIIFGVGVAVICGVICGLVPSWQATRYNLINTIRTGGRSRGGVRHWLRSLLVASEVAVALLILVLAGLYIKSYHNSLVIDPGFSTDKVFLATVDLTDENLRPQAGRAMIRTLLGDLRALPGVQGVSAASHVPLDLIIKELPGTISAPNGRQVEGLRDSVTPGYFATLGIPIIAGRDLSDPPHHGVSETIINDELARQLFPSQSPLGKTVIYDKKAFKIVGVVRTSKYNRLNEEPTPKMTISLGQFYTGRALNLFIRTDGAPLALEPAIHKAVTDLAPAAAFMDARTMGQHLEDNLFLIHMPAWLLGVLWPAAVVLAAIGIYSVVSYSVARQTQEIGIRLSLGATPGAIVRMIIVQGLRDVIVGIAIGLCLAYACSSLLSPTMVSVRVGEPSVFVPVIVGLTAVALLACLVPSRRTYRINPLDALRVE
jgi:predicted permease